MTMKTSNDDETFKEFIWYFWGSFIDDGNDVADCPAMSFLLVCWQIEIPI